MDFEISLMDLCDELGGMYNAVEFLINVSQKYKSEIYISGNLYRAHKILALALNEYNQN